MWPLRGGRGFKRVKPSFLNPASAWMSYPCGRPSKTAGGEGSGRAWSLSSVAEQAVLYQTSKHSWQHNMLPRVFSRCTAFEDKVLYQKISCCVHEAQDERSRQIDHEVELVCWYCFYCKIENISWQLLPCC